MKSILVATLAAVVAATTATVGADQFPVVAAMSSSRELAVSLPVAREDARAALPFIEKAARDRGLTRIRAYDKAVFVPLPEAQLSFIIDDSGLTLHVAVETEYRFAKGARDAVLAGLKDQGVSLFIRALQLQGQAEAGAEDKVAGSCGGAADRC
jgi:hypothetical protein